VGRQEEKAVKLIIQPDDGLTPLVKTIKKARRSIDIVIFRFDRPELVKALEAAVARGVTVRALIAHTNSGGDKQLRKLELKLLELGCTVARTADDLPRYHGKFVVIDDTLIVMGFNYTKIDIERSRSFGLITRDAKLVREALSLFEADRTRQNYSATHDRFVVSPENAREVLTAFIRRAKRQLLIYDAKITDKLVNRVLADRARAGVEIRVLGKLDKAPESALCRKLSDLRLHVRAIVRDGKTAFIGSQSLRKPELDGRREVGLITTDPRVAKKIVSVFEADWVYAKGDKDPDNKKNDKKGDKDKKEATSAAAGA
jgi:phosphatidylserine/phosphatidylglycerophosphate/cardiolipin synthase-like enzyme